MHDPRSSTPWDEEARAKNHQPRPQGASILQDPDNLPTSTSIILKQYKLLVSANNIIDDFQIVEFV